MAHLPNMSALALDRAPLVATGARKTSGKNSTGASKKPKVDGSDGPATPSARRRPEQEVAREERAKKAREERADFKKKLDERIEELLRTQEIKEGEAGWVPQARDSDGNFVDPNPDQSCCTTGGRLGDVLPEGLRRGEASPTPKRAPAAIQDPEAWALDRRYSKRGWAGAVRQWTEQVHRAWGDRPGDARWHRTPSRLNELE